MILTKAKPWAEIIGAVRSWGLKKVVVVGCGACSAQCGTGGTEGVKKIIANLERDNIEVLGSMVNAESCDKREVSKDLRLIRSVIEKCDGVIVAACGSGGQTLAEITGKPTVITADSIMISQTERIGIYHEKCRVCGFCRINDTGGICPVTQCPKSMLNGPCSGMMRGKCEVGGYIRNCVWVDVFQILKNRDRVDLFTQYQEILDWDRHGDHFTVDTRKEMKTYYARE